jgi:hypothetical protein
MALDLENEKMMSGHGIHPTSEIHIAMKFDISGKGSQIESWKGRAIQGWKPRRNSIEKHPMAGI